MQAHARWGEIERSLNIFERNALELLELLREVETNQELQVALLAQPGPEDVRKDYYQQLDQRLANFLSSFGALIDHTRRAIKFYTGTPLTDEFSQRNGAVRDMPEAGFLRRLRNMLLHRGSAPLGVRLRFPQEGVTLDPADPDIALTLDCACLLDWDGWNVSDRPYIQGAEPSMRLLDPVAATYFGTRAMYDWLEERVRSRHAKDIADVNALISRTHEMLDQGPPR